MKVKPLQWALPLLLIFSLISVAAASAQGGQTELIIVNYVGEPMTFTLDGTQYTVPGTNTMPGGGRSTFTLTPGQHAYSAQVPGADGTNGEIVLSAGQTQVLGARLERTGPVLSPTGEVLEKPKDQLVIFEASLTPSAPTSTPQPAPLQPLPSGEGALVLVNYIGETLTVNLNDQLYTVPANERLQVNLPPGQVTYSASAGFSGTNGTAQIVAGQYSGLGFSTEPVPQPTYDVGQPAPTPEHPKMNVFPVPLESVPVSQGSPSPTIVTTPAAPPQATGTPVSPSASEAELIVVNYIGETLTFTINNHQYQIAPDGGQLTLSLAPGAYTYTTSVPSASDNGSLDVTAGKTIQVGVALNVNNHQLELYIN
jgi:hypothetical protein